MRGLVYIWYQFIQLFAVLLPSVPLSVPSSLSRRNQKSMDSSISQRVVTTVLPPESTESSDSDSEEEPYKPKWTADRLLKMSESEIREMYNDIEEPFYYHHNQFKFRNKAQLRLDEEIEKQMAEYRERSKNLTAFDAIAPPRIAGLCGSTLPLTITDFNRPNLISLCKLALEEYNTKIQGENFVFDNLVKATNRGIACGRMYYITFQAKAGGTTETFQSQVADMVRGPPVIKSCSLKPAQPNLT